MCAHQISGGALAVTTLVKMVGDALRPILDACAVDVFHGLCRREMERFSRLERQSVAHDLGEQLMSKRELVWPNTQGKLGRL